LHDIGGNRVSDGNQLGSFSAVYRQRGLNYGALEAGILKLDGEDRSLNETQILARRIFYSLGKNKVFIGQSANIRLDWLTKFPKRSHPTMPVGALVPARNFRMLAHQNWNLLATFGDRKLQRFK